MKTRKYLGYNSLKAFVVDSLKWEEILCKPIGTQLNKFVLLSALLNKWPLVLFGYQLVNRGENKFRPCCGQKVFSICFWVAHSKVHFDVFGSSAEIQNYFEYFASVASSTYMYPGVHIHFRVPGVLTKCGLMLRVCHVFVAVDGF